MATKRTGRGGQLPGRCLGYFPIPVPKLTAQQDPALPTTVSPSPHLWRQHLAILAAAALPKIHPFQKGFPPPDPWAQRPEMKPGKAQPRREHFGWVWICRSRVWRPHGLCQKQTARALIKSHLTSRTPGKTFSLLQDTRAERGGGRQLSVNSLCYRIEASTEVKDALYSWNISSPWLPWNLGT